MNYMNNSNVNSVDNSMIEVQELHYDFYIITLKNRTDRQEKFNAYYKKYLDKINVFYGLTIDEIKKNKKEITTAFCNNFCTISMIGCACSHVQIWDKISKSNSKKLSIIIEDDTFVDIEKLELFYKNIYNLFNIYNDRLCLQLTGQGVWNKENFTMQNLNLQSYKYHFFLGAYVISPLTAKIFYEYFYNNKISYHVDYTLNHVYEKEKITPLIMNGFAQQKGLTDSNMSNKHTKKCFDTDNYDELNYVKDLPIMSVNNVIITFFLVILILVGILCVIYKNVFMFFFLGFLFLEIINLDK